MIHMQIQDVSQSYFLKINVVIKVVHAWIAILNLTTTSEYRFSMLLRILLCDNMMM